MLHTLTAQSDREVTVFTVVDEDLWYTMRNPLGEEYLCMHAHAHVHTHTHRHKHWLPGLCHSAAVAAAAPRAPAHPQLFPRLTAIKVVCEFPKTRHLYLLPLTSAASVPSFFPPHFLLPFLYSDA